MNPWGIWAGEIPIQIENQYVSVLPIYNDCYRTRLTIFEPLIKHNLTSIMKQKLFILFCVEWLKSALQWSVSMAQCEPMRLLTFCKPQLPALELHNLLKKLILEEDTMAKLDGATLWSLCWMSVWQHMNLPLGGNHTPSRQNVELSFTLTWGGKCEEHAAWAAGTKCHHYHTACDSWDIKTRQEAHCKGAQCQEHMKNLLFFSLALGLQGVK